ncbi:peptidogalycan biosysnthesis protein [Aestuariivivens sediminicola]|uniref:peptidogalycan biosysnthesis protein n=1 Tax=Aestuariivivens sediminicola TaxID=2913560 RepID=UPI001F595432|nr:peptidogalycan biosysnthesis protein [Aestuariivivens sediminicola]
MLKLIPYKSIHDIESELWDSLVPSSEIYHKHDFIGLLEDIKEEQTDHWYLLIYRESLLVATACLSKFRIELDCLMQYKTSWIKFLRRYFNNFMMVDVLMCGLPISLGQRNLVIRKGLDSGPILESVVSYMKKIAKSRNINHLFFKEISENENHIFKILSDHGFIQAFSLPYMEMDVHWDSFEDYVNSLKHHYRRKIKKGLAKLNIDERNFLFNVKKTGMQMNSYNSHSAEEFYRGYMAIMQRATTKLETLPYEFFKLLFKVFQHKMEYLEIKNGNEVLATALLIKEGRGLHFMFCGLPQYKNSMYDPYFNLLYAIVNLAINSSCKKIFLGQTAYWSKQQIGGYPKQRFIYYHSNIRIIHHVIHKLKRYIFPQTNLREINIFKSDTPVKEKHSVKMKYV